MNETLMTENALLGDEQLQESLKTINPKWGDFCIRTCSEVWGLPLIDQKTKAFITLAIDVVNCNASVPGSPFETHLDMAFKQGATHEEIEELFLFLCAYAGFNKAVNAFVQLNEIKTKRKTGFGTTSQPIS